MNCKNLTIRLSAFCLLFWLLILGLYVDSSLEPRQDQLMAIFGVVKDISVDESNHGFVIIIENGIDGWNIFFEESSEIPEIGRAVIIAARKTTEWMTTAVSFNYP